MNVFRLAVLFCEAIPLIANATLVLIGIENDTHHTRGAHLRKHGYRFRYPAVGSVGSIRSIGNLMRIGRIA